MIEEMDHRPPELLKSLADELSEILLSGNSDPGRRNDLLDRLGLMRKKKGSSTAPETSPAGLPDTIGIWKKVSKNGKTFYRRDAAKQFHWVAWADVQDIFPRGSRRRVILLGESVARGYLYDPHYNVAKELEAILTSRVETADIEVVDLARTSLGMNDLCELMRSCVALEPELVVIFAGNNWEPDVMHLFDQDDWENIGEAFRREGFPAVKSYIEEKFDRSISRFLETVRATLIEKDIPVIFVIPEFNLKDWKSNHIEQGLLWLPAGEMEKWLCAKAIAEAARANNDIDIFGSAVREMVRIDPSNPLGHEYLGDHYILKQQYAEARLAFEQARDMALFSGGRSTPRCSKLIREVILREAPGLGIHAVDLPGIFASEYPAHLPDRYHFLDYCHLTVEGIKLAMRHTAQVITTVLTGKEISVGDIRASGLYPGDEALAVAHFGAAIHNSHNGQSQEILRYHCKKAVGHSSKIKISMTEFADFSSRRVSSNFCKTFQQIVFGGQMRQYEGAMLTLQHPRDRKLMDIELVNSIVEAFGEESNTLDNMVSQLRASEHGVDSEPLNLLESFYSTTHYNDYAGKPQTTLFSARTTESNFSFIVPPGVERVDITISCRTPGREECGRPIRIHINGEKDALTEIPMSRDWTSWSFTLSGKRLNAGTNRLSIHWPYSFRPMPAEKAYSLNTLTKLMYPVLGEIFSFQAVSRSLHDCD